MKEARIGWNCDGTIIIWALDGWLKMEQPTKVPECRTAAREDGSLGQGRSLWLLTFPCVGNQP